ncbi:MAG TPA: pitrilysin family protein [Gemmatimonadales bacterium]|nr:pitrilysin family protein [Gemmatimonadales bacterium]
MTRAIPASLLAAIASLALASAAGAQSRPPARGTAPRALTIPYSIDTLPNGLTLIIHEDHTVPVVAVNTWYHVGSGDEEVHRTGFAHLFEHLMFMGSQHAPYPMFDRLLEAAGADNNGTTNEDRTAYYESGPANALPLMLWLDADRMGWLLPTMDSAKVDLQRDVVKNERRQRVENQPYGKAWDVIPSLLFPPGHPYSWPVIGSMADLSAASLEDVKDFFRKFYAPNNATLVVSGDVQTAAVRAQVRKYFGAIPRGPAITRTPTPTFTLARDTAVVLTDRVQLPRLYYMWHSTRAFGPDDAALNVLAYVLAGAKNGRLTEPLVYTQQLAADVNAFQDGRLRDGEFGIIATARPGHALPELQAVIDSQVARLAADGPTARELEQAKNSFEASTLEGLEYGSAVADQLNSYYYFTGTPDYLAKDIARTRAVTAADVERVARTYLQAPRVIVSVVPEGKPKLAASAAEVGR